MGVEHTGNGMDQRERNGGYNPQERGYPIKGRYDNTSKRKFPSTSKLNSSVKD